MSGEKAIKKNILQNKIPILSFEYFKKEKNTKTVYIVCMFKFQTVLSFNPSPQK